MVAEAASAPAEAASLVVVVAVVTMAVWMSQMDRPLSGSAATRPLRMAHDPLRMAHDLFVWLTARK